MKPDTADQLDRAFKVLIGVTVCIVILSLALLAVFWFWPVS